MERWRKRPCRLRCQDSLFELLFFGESDGLTSLCGDVSLRGGMSGLSRICSMMGVGKRDRGQKGAIVSNILIFTC